MPKIEWSSFLLLLFTSIKGHMPYMNETFGSVGNLMYLPCCIHNVTITKRVDLILNGDDEYMRCDYENSTCSFYCIQGHPNFKKCWAAKELSYINGSLVNFALNPWPGLDGKPYSCSLRHKELLDDKHGPEITIRLEGENGSKTVGPTTTPTPVATPDHNSSYPNATNCPTGPVKKDNANSTGGHSTATLVGSIFGAILGVLIVMVVIWRCKKFRNPSASEPPVNNQLQELNQNGKAKEEELET